MAIRVAHVGTGNVGGLALAELITNPLFELTGVCVSTPEKVGKDAGELCGVGLEPGTVTGIAAGGGLDAVLATKPEGVMPDKYIARVEAAAQQGNSSLFITGVDPGFANDLIPFALAGTCQRIEQVRCMEIHDYASYNGVEVMNYMGFAQP